VHFVGDGADIGALIGEDGGEGGGDGLDVRGGAEAFCESRGGCIVVRGRARSGHILSRHMEAVSACGVYKGVSVHSESRLGLPAVCARESLPGQLTRHGRAP
jgi:hypothetical protein